MNKKGQIEMADLAGFILISLTVIIFGALLKLDPESKIEVYSARENYFVKYELLDYLNSEIDGKNIADWIVLSVKNENLNLIEEKSKKILKGPCYKLLIKKGNKILKEINNFVGTCKAEMKENKVEYVTLIKNYFGEDIMVELNLAGFRRP